MINDIIDKPISKFIEKVKDTYGFSGNAGITISTTTTMTTTSQYSLGGAQYLSGSIMGVTKDARDNAIEVTYSTKPDRGGTLNAMSTSTTKQPFTTTRVLKPIINNTVRPAIVSNTVLNPMLNNNEQVAI